MKIGLVINMFFKGTLPQSGQLHSHQMEDVTISSFPCLRLLCTQLY